VGKRNAVYKCHQVNKTNTRINGWSLEPIPRYRQANEKAFLDKEFEERDVYSESPKVSPLPAILAACVLGSILGDLPIFTWTIASISVTGTAELVY
jgi:hypothetical protein